MAFKGKLFTGLAAATAILLGVAFMSYSSLLRNAEDRQLVVHTYRVRRSSRLWCGRHRRACCAGFEQETQCRAQHGDGAQVREAGKKAAGRFV